LSLFFIEYIGCFLFVIVVPKSLLDVETCERFRSPSMLHLLLFGCTC